MAELTQLLDAAAAGDNHAAGEILPLVYDELRRLASSRMAAERPDHTLNATALVHEAYLRLVGDQSFRNRGHFFGAAAEAMRRILIENARRKNRLRHGGDLQRVEFDVDLKVDRDNESELLELDELIATLALEDSASAELAKLRIFVGMSVDQAAEALNISRATAYRNWTYAKTWLRSQMLFDRDSDQNKKD